MTAQNLKKSLLNYAISGKLSAKWRKENQANSVISELDNSVILGLDPRISTENSQKDFEPPFEIPNSWQWVKLGDICEITSSKRILKSEYMKSGIPFYRTKEIVELSNKEKISTEFFISENRYNEIKSKFGIPQTNDLLISAVGTIGKIWLVDTNKPFYFKDGNLIWLKNSNSFNSLFLKYMLENQISKNKFSGTAYNALTIIFLKNFHIPLPPKDEQEFIVNELEKLMRLADDYEVEFQRLEHCKKELKKLKKSILNYSISGKLSTKWRKENSRIPNDVKSKIPSDFNPPFEIPDSWQWKKLGDICEIISGTSYTKSDIKQSGIRILRGGNVNDLSSKIDILDDDVFIDLSFLNKNSTPLKDDIIIVSSTGSDRVIGKPAIIENNLENTQIGAFLRIIRIKLEFKNFIHKIFLSEFYRSYIRSLIKGTNIYNIKNSYLENFYIPLPPLAEQEQIVKKIDELFELLDEIQKHVK